MHRNLTDLQTIWAQHDSGWQESNNNQTQRLFDHWFLEKDRC